MGGLGLICSWCNMLLIFFTFWQNVQYACVPLTRQPWQWPLTTTTTTETALDKCWWPTLCAPGRTAPIQNLITTNLSSLCMCSKQDLVCGHSITEIVHLQPIIIFLPWGGCFFLFFLSKWHFYSKLCCLSYVHVLCWPREINKQECQYMILLAIQISNVRKKMH